MTKQLEQEPACRTDAPHGWFELGTEDNGEKISRCGNCGALKYVAPDDAVRYEVFS